MENYKICAIHQPNFFPWLGFFDKIKKSDVFVLLDDVQFPKTGGGYPNRVKINIQGISKWITVPIVRQHGTWNINETIFLDTNWREKIVKTLQANYAKSKNYKKYKNFIFELILNKESNLALYNENVIYKICKLLKINTSHIVKSSSLNISTISTQRLIDICKKVDCNIYLSGGGGDNYQEKKLFDKNNIKLIYQNFKHPIYPQQNDEFIAGLSVIDFIFNGL